MKIHIMNNGARFPDIIKPVLQTENQYAKGFTNISGTYNFPRAKGKYIAMCEGDDYWTSPDKLQRQVDYLEANPGCSLVFHSARVEVQGRALTERTMRPYRGRRIVMPREIIDTGAMSKMLLYLQGKVWYGLEMLKYREKGPRKFRKR